MADFIIIGAGIGGLAAAHALLNLGHGARVYEATSEFRAVGAGVVLGANAMRALHELNLPDAVAALGAPVRQLQLLDQQGRLLQAADTTEFTRRLGFDNVGVHRADLQRTLLAGLPPNTVQRGMAFERFEETPSGVRVHFADGSEAHADALIGADGLNSRVRRQLWPAALPRYAGYTCWRAVVEAGPLGLAANESAETWGTAGRRFGYVPVGGGRVYWFACLNSPEPRNPRYQAYRIANLQQEFAGFHAPVPGLLALTRDDDLLWNDILDLPPLAHFVRGLVVLLGDAAHATTPNMGQGAGMAIEDAAVLARCMHVSPTNLPVAFQKFEQQRLTRTARIVRTSWQLLPFGC